MKHAILHYYRASRLHQLDTYGPSGFYINGVDQRQHTGGGAAYGCHALAAYQSARSTIHFRANLAERNASFKKRSRAARLGWATRKAAASRARYPYLL